MNYYIENEIEITDTTVIEYQIDTSGGTRYDTIIGLSNKKGHETKFGFLSNGNDIFGNGYKFKSKQVAFKTIVDNIRYAINRNEYPLSKLKIDGVEVEIFNQII